MNTDDLPNGDCHLRAIMWPETDSPDLKLRLRKPDDTSETLRFTWVRDLSINLSPAAFVGLTWRTNYTPKADRTAVVIDFGSDGTITFECGEILKT